MSLANDRAQRRIESVSKTARIIILISTLMAGPVFAEESERQNIDPFEAINRPIYKFNDITDKFLLRPLGKGYNFITPRPVRTGIGNFYDNITYPVTIVNSLLQGKGTQAIYDLNRFLFNSVFGVLGFVDVASSRGFPRHDEDFGQTFAKWGIPQGPYIVIPLLGPSTVRDGIGILGNVRVNPLVQMDNRSVRDKLLILWTIETRAALIGPDELVQDAFDPYLFVRDAYLQNRQFLINDSSTPTEEFFEDFEEDF